MLRINRCGEVAGGIERDCGTGYGCGLQHGKDLAGLCLRRQRCRLDRPLEYFDVGGAVGICGHAKLGAQAGTVAVEVVTMNPPPKAVAASRPEASDRADPETTVKTAGPSTMTCASGQLDFDATRCQVRMTFRQ